MSFDKKLALAYVTFITWFQTTIISTFIKLLFRTSTENKIILINRDGAFGDSIVALPALSIIRQNFPDAQIDLLSVNEEGISFKDLNLNKNVINTLYNIKKSQRRETLKKLKHQGYDLFIQLPQNIGLYKSIRNMFLVRFYLNIRYAFGWDSGRVKSFMRLQKQYNQITTNTHRFIDMLENKGLSGDIAYPIDNVAPTDNETKKLIDTTQAVTFLIGGKLQPKKWPLNHWVSLAKLIGNKQKIFIVGGNEDNEDAEYICSKVDNSINLCGQFTIPELRYVFEKAKLAISLDTGAMHLCDTTKTKLIALFSTRDLSNKWFPTSKSAVVIEKVLPCSFCLKTRCKDNICMSNILPNEVFSKMNALLLD